MAGGLGLGLALANSSGANGGVPLHSVSGAALAFGTTISIEVVHADRPQAELAITAALAAARQVDRLMTLHRTDSQIAILNRTGVLEQAHPWLLRVLAYADDLSRSSEGAFDITVQSLWQAFSAASQQNRLPTDAERRAAMALVDWRQVQVTSQRVRLARPGMAITLNGIAQGFAVDRARAVLDAHGIRHALIDTGEFGARGRKTAQQAWTIGIREPRDAQQLAGVLPMQQRCVATSGDYQTVFTPDFVHHHIFDPASGDSPLELASVTVVAPTGLQADGLSTTLMVLGAQRAMALVATLTEVDVLLIDKQGRAWQSGNWPV
ncbi:FAD:protein FMN transferase [Actimicrobium sp. CCC2.4]|uniref:FAD:protein FMN transferase n=1 Tax=Actimicrobium sp. CCC2.4 TaxID=3048606 RepID=UPI002AC8F787|nr:FAD:protein FMN transferase [Actimicrobium sp. CCC2.4]MEB0136635.1 FAD:protein FMN transferase [Actimicrobium sp. CCC2.4]WPX31681.1 FAD:protein FMN transferase [Actimicrobium sp. CCC2.4]